MVSVGLALALVLLLALVLVLVLVLVLWFCAKTHLNDSGVICGQRQLQAAAVPAELFVHTGITHAMGG